MSNPKAINLKLNVKRLFPKVFNAAQVVRFRSLEELTLPVFMRAFGAELRRQRITWEMVDGSKNLLLIERSLLVQATASKAEARAAADSLREKMQAEGTVLVGFVIYLDDELRWQQVQISEKWLKDVPQDRKENN